MAGEWIKMRTNLWDDPRVSRLCDLTGSSEAAIVGGLYWLWAMADEHTEDGLLPGMTTRAIDRKTGVPGLGEALVSIGWLSAQEDGLTIIGFEEHNGASAKRRCQDAQRKANVRKDSATGSDDVQQVSASQADKTRTDHGQNAPDCGAREEKRREDISTSSLRSDVARKPRATKRCPADFVVTDEMAEAARAECPGLDLNRETTKFRDHEFKQAHSDWAATWRNWMRNAFERMPNVRGSPPSETAYQRSMRERVAQAAGSMAHIVAAKPPGQTRPLEPWEEAIENRNQTTAIGMD